jgi:phosphate transport system protein
MTTVDTARVEFDRDLQTLRASLVSLTNTAAQAIASATTALVDGNLEEAQHVLTLTRRLEGTYTSVERGTYQLLAQQQPVAGDLRLLVSAFKISADCRRMGSLAGHVSKVVARAYPRSAIPDGLVDIFSKMGAVASRIADGAGVTLAARDAEDAARLDVDDDAMDGLQRALFRALVAEWPHSVETAVNVALLGRYYERFADHAVAIAQSVVFIVTGARPEGDPPCQD